MTYYKHESAMEITDSTNTIVGVTCGCCYEQVSFSTHLICLAIGLFLRCGMTIGGTK